MTTYPVTHPSHLEKLLFDAGLVELRPLADTASASTDTPMDPALHDSVRDRAQPDVRDPNGWDNSLWGCTRWEFFAHAFREGQRILDVGCGEGRLTLYLTRRFPEVIGLDISAVRLAEARAAAEVIGMEVNLQQGNIEALPCDDAGFDGVSASGNVFTYDFNTRRMFAEIHRVLRPGGVFALEQWPGDPNAPAKEGPRWFIGADPPAFTYTVGQGLYGRAYQISLRSDTPQADALRAVAPGFGHLSPTQVATCEALLDQMRRGDLSFVARATYAGDHRALAADELPRLLTEAGFTDIIYWAPPDGRTFARSLQQAGLLDRLTQDDLLPCLGALVAASSGIDLWVEQVTCRKPPP